MCALLAYNEETKRYDALGTDLTDNIINKGYMWQTRWNAVEDGSFASVTMDTNGWYITLDRKAGKEEIKRERLKNKESMEFIREINARKDPVYAIDPTSDGDRTGKALELPEWKPSERDGGK